jgi:hypothetical protein
MSVVLGGIVGIGVLFLLGALMFLGEKIGDRIAYGRGRRSTTSADAISAAQYDRKRGDFSGLGGM